MSLKMKYFVLNPRSKEHDDPYAKASRKAMRAYALAIGIVDLQFQQELLAWADNESDRDLEIADHEKDNKSINRDKK